MTTAEAAPHIHEQKVLDTIQGYISSNHHSRAAEQRWLCTVLEQITETIAQVRVGRLSDENKREVGKFRAAELTEQIAAKRKETAALESELTKYAGL